MGGPSAALVVAAPWDVHLSGLAAGAVYAVVLGIAFAEAALLLGFVLPGDTVLFAAGLLAGRPDSGVNVAVLAVGTFLATVSGYAVGYQVGRRLGRPLLLRRAGRWANAENLARAERFYADYGALAVIAARFLAWVRTFTPFLAGAVRMPWGRFMVANVVGGLGWGVGLVLLGWAAAGVPWLRHGAFALAALIVAASAAGAVVQWRRSRRAARRRSELAGDPQQPVEPGRPRDR